MNPWNPDGTPEQQAQAAPDGSPDPTFPRQNRKGNRVRKQICSSYSKFTLFLKKQCLSKKQNKLSG